MVINSCHLLSEKTRQEKKFKKTKHLFGAYSIQVTISLLSINLGKKCPHFTDEEVTPQRHGIIYLSSKKESPNLNFRLSNLEAQAVSRTLTQWFHDFHFIKFLYKSKILGQLPFGRLFSLYINANLTTHMGICMSSKLTWDPSEYVLFIKRYDALFFPERHNFLRSASGLSLFHPSFSFSIGCYFSLPWEWWFRFLRLLLSKCQAHILEYLYSLLPGSKA